MDTLLQVSYMTGFFGLLSLFLGSRYRHVGITTLGFGLTSLGVTEFGLFLGLYWLTYII